ncbi:site-specific DNA-methyltransferase [Pseudomonas sp. ZM23]|uniref:site-specific DNA-methyltransferase (adenine-specific) n=1 Tax=Pseudomonas triclosanedens TaxID=2961893 RepID=A0ABY7A3K2_9PSED|nr:site-specific DNA-methyltransferase [Pseudomonas triclosanedens]MCP8465015.1 site-specific DNA-methyltransferase [Pseudomonas triclosanedens]MCP8470273.1 site-specific DNA-methyltransferase [Pseudomonas triclosanedens]MCP8476078.1 site-specific DNA-methyltransferase [Pseudomonas triclosanedens]WAI51688.1 site-specific DNA-methyltransferase [Pseudomonas triclosanedens]
MEKLKMHSPNLTQDNIARIRDLFPGCVTEAKGEDGTVKLAVDFDQLRQELAESIVEGPQERYQLNWPGKREALLTANAPIAKTLRPCRDESVDFDTTKNLFIEGDNLDALKLLQETYLGKVKMIYIDPPYNTGNDFIYEDDFSVTADEFLKRSNQKDESGNRLVANTMSNGRFHSDWLSMMYPRLKLASRLLRDDGIVFVHIDDNEVDSLGKLCAEVFGEDNFINIITVKTKVGGVSGSSEGKSLKDTTEFIWAFAKNKENLQLNPVYIKTKLSDRIRAYEQGGKSWKYTSIITKLADKFLIKEDVARGVRFFGYKTLETMSIQAFARENNLTEDAVYDQFADKIFQTTNAQSSVRLTAMRETANIDVPMVGCEYKPIKGKNEGSVIEVLYKGEQRRMMMFLSDAVQRIDGSYYYLDKVSSLWDDIEYNNLTKEGDIEFPNGKKPIRLLQRIIALTTAGDDLILDFFAGSGSTAHAVMQQNAEDGSNRRFILIQLPEKCDQEEFSKISDISKERLRRAGKQVLEGTCKEGWRQDVGFRAMQVDTSNMADVYYAPDALDRAKFDLFVDNIKPDRTPEDLMFQVMLDWGLDLALPITKQSIQGKDVFFVDGNALAACFDASGSIDEAFVKELAKHQPLRVVFRDAGYKNSAVKINVEQIFKLLSPATEVKCI